MSQFDLVIQNGTIVTSSELFEADLGILGERIAGVGQHLVGRRYIDARNKLVLPGFVDPHVHMQLSVEDMVSADDWLTGSISAACGGTTTLIDFVTPQSDQFLAQAVEMRRAEADARIAVDYALHLTAVDAAPVTLQTLSSLADQGYTTLKIYTTYPALRLEDSEILAVMDACRENGILPLVHCENHAGIAFLQQRFLAKSRTGPEWHPHSRPPLVEVEAVQRVLACARLVDTPVYLVHLSCAESLRAVRQARAVGQIVYAEVCVQHLLLSDEVYSRKDAANFVLSPPLRPARHQQALWAGLAGGEIDTVATDHCPWTRAQRERGKDNFTRIPNGAPGVETRLPLLLEAGVNQNKIDLCRLVEVCAANPARVMGLYPRKGTLVVGSDADVVIVDPEQAWSMAAGQLHQHVDHCPYEGWQGQGYPEIVLLRGKVIVQQFEFIGDAGQGRFMARQRSISKGAA